jgi:hypothetical protein
MGFWMMMGLVSTLTLVFGGLYILYCMSRYASSMDRLASAVEELVQRRQDSTDERPEHPSTPPVPPIPVPPVSTPAATFPVIPVSSPAPAATTGADATATPPASSPLLSDANVERQSDEYSR